MSLRQRLIGRRAAGDELALVRQELKAVRKEVASLRKALGKEVHLAAKEQKTADRRHRAELERVVDILRLVYDEEPATRRRLYALREDPEYELAFTEAEPLVSIVIPTFDRPDTLADRAIPSALSQTYANVEVVVVGDGAGQATQEAVSRIADSRLAYFNRTVRGPYPSDVDALRKVGGAPPFNEGVRRARGRWIAGLADDDAFTPDHVETLLRSAQRERYEFCYGRVRRLLPDGTESVLGRFPPDGTAYFGQSSLYHGGLRFIEAELGDALFMEAFDKSMCRRMLRAGVRVGFVDKVVTDYHWQPRRDGDVPPQHDD